MSEFLEELKIIEPKKKDTIITEVKQVIVETDLKTQAQNLREYSTKTESIEEILLYLEYQCARDKKWIDIGDKIINLVKKHREDGIEVIRFLLGVFARWVIIQSKKNDNKEKRERK